MIRRRPAERRSAVAAVETFFVVTFVLIPVMLGVWEVGRLVQVQQGVSNAAREGARLAAQGRTIKTDGTVTQIVVEVPPPNSLDIPNVKAAVFQSLAGAGLTNRSWGDVTVDFQWLAPVINMPPPDSRAPGAAAVYEGQKGQRFQVSVSIPFDKVRWSSLGLVNPTVVKFTVQWRMMVDDPFVINPNLPGPPFASQ
jgi:Flp pilus assembly protein TadG